MAKPTTRYSFSAVESLSFTSHDISATLADGDKVSIDFRSSDFGLKISFLGGIDHKCFGQFVGSIRFFWALYVGSIRRFPAFLLDF